MERVKIGQAPRLSPLTVCKIWVFADIHGIPSLGNTAIDTLHEQQVLVWCTPSSAIRYVYEHTKSSSLLRLFLQDSFSKTMSIESVLSRDREEHTVDFLHDVLSAIVKRKEGGKLDRMQWARLDRCRWHNLSGPGGTRQMGLMS
jgi:hypothetical protein